MIVNLLSVCVFNLHWTMTTLLSIYYSKGERASICPTDPTLTFMCHYYHIYIHYDVYDLKPLFLRSSPILRLTGSYMLQSWIHLFLLYNTLVICSTVVILSQILQ